jgi:hypothetical protein
VCVCVCVVCVCVCVYERICGRVRGEEWLTQSTCARRTLFSTVVAGDVVEVAFSRPTPSTIAIQREAV